jgi:iron complex transport system permease protein
VKRRLIVIGILTALLLCTIVISLNVGATSASLSQLPKLWSEIATGKDLSPDATILWTLRLPRILLACLTGAALAVAGAGYQGLFRNPLADPFVIGSSSGAAVGVALVVVFNVQSTFLGYGVLSLAAFGGALLAVLCVFLIAGRSRETQMVSLLLAGVALSTFLSACVSLLMLIGSERLVVIFGWLMGSLSGRGWTEVGAFAPMIAVGLIVMMMLSRSLAVL